MDPASHALTLELPPNVRKSISARARHGNVPRTTVHYRHKGRQSRKAKDEGQQYLTPPEEKAFVDFILRMSASGSPIRIKYIPELAFCIARRRTTNRPAGPPHKNWPQDFRRRHPEIKSRNNRAMAWERHDNNIYDKVVHWFDVIGPEIHRPDVESQNWYNMDETGIMLSMLGTVKVLIGKDDRRNYRGAGVKRTMVTAIECVSASGEHLHPMIIWPASTHRSNWTTYPTPGWTFALSETGYNDSYLSLKWIKEVFDPQTKARANGKPRVLVCDGFGTHETLEVLGFCFENNILLCRLPSHTSHKLQPCDVSVFGPLKSAYREQVERLYRGGLTNINKEHFTTIYSQAREKAMTKRNILAGWAKAGLFPFNPARVLCGLTKPDAPLTVQAPRADEALQDDIVQTPVTPVSSEAVRDVLNQIKQCSSSDKQHDKLVQKLANAAEKSIARQALDEDYIRVLKTMNNEAKTRRSTKSEILGKARVMTYEDIVAERARRHAAAQTQGKSKVKGKRGRPRKATIHAEEGPANDANSGLQNEAAVPEASQLDGVEPDASQSLAGVAWTSKIPVDPMLKPWRAPVARMC